MAITKVLARKGRLDVGIRYILNGDKTQEQILTAHLNCDPGRECRQMLETKQAVGKEGGVQYYHMIQSFQPGEVTSEQALEIATEFAKEHLPGYETVIGVHVDKNHIHAHLIFNSVNADTGEKYHSNARSYYQQIRAISDRLCREHGLSVIMQGSPGKAVSYIEWLRQSKGQPTFRSMLEADLRTAIQDANDLGHFFMLMEHKGWEISHGNRLGFRLRGQERFMYPGRKNPLFTEESIRAAIQSGLEDIEAGRRPAMIYRAPYRPYKKHPKYTGFMALYVHYLYVLGKIGQRQYPPRMTPQLRQEVMKAERYREQFDFLRENNIATQGDMTAFQSRTEATLASLMKQRTILNVRKKKRRPLYSALADVEALAPAKALYEDGLSGMEAEFARYMEAVAVLEACPIPRERLTAEKAEIYEQVAEVNRQIRAERKKLARKHKLLFSVIRDKDDRGKVLDVILPVTELDRANAIFERILYTLPPEQERKPERPLQQGHEVFRERQAPERERNTPDRNQEDSRPREGRPEPQEPPRENLPLAERMARQGPPKPPEGHSPKKDFRSGQGSNDTRPNSSTPRKAPVSKMTSDRPSVEDRLKGYRARLDRQKPSAPARDKTRVKPKAR